MRSLGSTDLKNAQINYVCRLRLQTFCMRYVLTSSWCVPGWRRAAACAAELEVTALPQSTQAGFRGQSSSVGSSGQPEIITTARMRQPRGRYYASLARNRLTVAAGAKCRVTSRTGV